MATQPRDVCGRFLKGPSKGHPKGPSQGQSKGPSQGQPGVVDVAREVSDAESDGSKRSMREASMAVESSGTETAEELRRRRKRPSTPFLLSGFFGSDTETEDTAAVPKVNTARRGRKKPTSGTSREGFLKPDDELEGVLQSRKFGKRGLGAAAVTDTGSETDVATVADVSSMNAQELRAQAGHGLACILEVARKSGNLKGEFVGRLKRSASVLRDVVDALADRSEAEETRRLRGENSRLRLEVESCKAEVKALRRGFSEARTEAAAATASAAAVASPVPSTAQLGSEVVEELKRSLVVTLGQIVNARLAAIEDRLLPAPTIRPPLRADAKRAVAAAVPPGPAPQLAKPAPQHAKLAPQLARPASKRQAGQPTKAAPAPSSAPVVAVPSTSSRVPLPPTAPQEGAWTVVTRKGKGRRKGRGKSTLPSATGPVAATRPAAPATGKVASAPRVALTTPRTEAVVLALQPEAAGKGVTYGAILQMAQEKVDLQELGIDQLRFRRTATGARKLEIPGSQNCDKADRLAEKLRGVLSEVAHVSRPLRSTDIRISGLDDAATKEKVAAAVAKAGACDVQHIRVGEIRLGPGGVGAALVSCPIPAAKALREKGRLLIGWSSVRVVALAAKPLRCYKCYGLGHTRPMCPASSNRGDLCFRCGDAGHLVASCQKTSPHCAICAESGRPAKHMMGARDCVPPKMRGKATGTQAFPAAPIPAARGTRRPSASEEVAMLTDG